MKTGSVTRAIACAAACGALWLNCARGLAADGDLDPSFGMLGKVTTSLAPSSEGADVAVQRDGRLVVVGTLSDGVQLPRMVVARYTTSGELDPTFNHIGYVTAESSAGFGGYGHHVAIQSDGRILALGSSEVITHGATEILLIRYEPDGTVDPTFGVDGMARVNDLLGGTGAVSLTAGGAILVSATLPQSLGTPLATVQRVRPDGSRDARFGAAGFAEVPRVPSYASSMAVRCDGTIVVGAALLTRDLTQIFSAARFLPDGTVDTTFGRGGVGSDAESGAYVVGSLHDLALQFDDGIVLAGSAGGAFTLARLRADGGLDASFANGGVLSDSFALSAQAVRAVGGRLIAAGGGPQFALARVFMDGTLDPTFGSGGRVATSFGDEFSTVNGLAVQDDGALVAVGSTRSGTTSRIAVARYLSTPRACVDGPDADGDGVCDGADECPDGSPFLRARLLLSDASSAPCDGRLMLTGVLALPAGAAVDPPANGLRIVVRDGNQQIVVDETLPPGAYDAETRAGWSASLTAGTSSWRFARPAGEGGAVRRAVVQRRAASPEILRLALAGHRACLVAAEATLPLTATVVLSPAAAGAPCGGARFEGAGDGTCALRRSGTAILASSASGSEGGAAARRWDRTRQRSGRRIDSPLH